MITTPSLTAYPNWWSFPIGGSGTVPSGTALGDMLYWDGTAWTALPIGAAGEVLTVVAGIPAWQVGGTLPVGVQGDVLYHNGVGWVVLNAGTNGQYLQTQGAGANPQWADVTNTKEGELALAAGQQTATLTFSSAFVDNAYSVAVQVRNTVDATPAGMSAVVTSKLAGSFDVYLSAPTLTANYVLEYVATRE